MVRTKKHFKPPSEDDDSSSSSSEDEQQPIMGRGKQLVGRGKQLVPSGRGKQLRAPEPAEGDSSDDSSSSDDDEPSSNLPPSPSRGKQLNRPTGRGKQLRAPSPQQNSDSSDSSDDEIVQPRGGGKQFGMNRGMGKQLPRPTEPMEEDSDDSSSDDEPWNAPRGQGKQLRPPAAAAAAAKEESDMDESSEEEEEVVVKKKPAPKKKAAPKAKTTKKKKAPPKKKQPVIESDSEDYADTDEDESDFEPEPSKKKKAAPKRKGRPPARAAATRATRSAKAAAVESEEDDDSSDESSDEEQEWDMETFDTQKLVQGAEDKKMLDALPEIERESILAERFEKLKAEADMKKAVKEQKRREREQKRATGEQKKKSTRKRAATTKAKKAAPAKKKRVTKKKADSEEESDEDMDDTLGDEALAASMAGKRASTRNLAKKGKQFKKQAALAKIKSARANKQAAMEESESDLDYGKDSDDSDDDYEEATPWQKKQKASKKPVPESSDDDASMGVDDDDERQGRKRTEDVEADLEDYRKVSIPRRRLGMWCHEPWFEKAVMNHYVRLSVGRDNKTQKACYRFCKIEGVVIKNEYTFTYTDDNGEHSVTTDKWLQVSFGSAKRDFKMVVASESRPVEDDLNKYVSQMKTERLGDELLTKKQAKKMRKSQEEISTNYTYTKDDIDMLVKEKRKRSKKSLNLGMEKTRTGIAVQAAKEEIQEAKNRLEIAEEEITEAGTEEETLEDNLKKAKEALDVAEKKLEETLEEQQRIQKEDKDRENRLRENTKVQNWAKVNQRAKLANRNADFQAFREEQERLKKTGSAEPKFDPYARRRQKPKNLWEVGGKNQPSDKDKASDVVTEEEKSKEAMERDDADVGKEGGNGENKREEVPEPKKMQMPAQANKFAFDDDIVIGDLASLGVGKKKVRTGARKGISLEDYQERKTAGTL